jgi:antitoxin VapB
MALSIQNSKTEKLAREVAAQSGETITQAITRALEERLERMRGRRTVSDTAAEILKISKRCSQLPDRDVRMPEEILGYDELGVPR